MSQILCLSRETAKQGHLDCRWTLLVIDCGSDFFQVDFAINIHSLLRQTQKQKKTSKPFLP